MDKNADTIEVARITGARIPTVMDEISTTNQTRPCAVSAASASDTGVSSSTHRGVKSTKTLQRACAELVVFVNGQTACTPTLKDAKRKHWRQDSVIRVESLGTSCVIAPGPEDRCLIHLLPLSVSM